MNEGKKKGRGKQSGPTIGARRLILEGGFHEGLALLRVLPPGIMLTLTTRAMGRKGTPSTNLPSAALGKGEKATQHPYLLGFRDFLDEPRNLACSEPAPHQQEDGEHHH